MGGSSSSGWSPTVPSSPCERINIRAGVNSPQAEALKDIKLNDVLTLSLQQTPQISIIVSSDSHVVGSLTGPTIIQLINCIENGHQYSATVVDLDGGSCVVQVEAI